MTEQEELRMLRERLGPRGLEVVFIDDRGHYVNVAVKAEIERLRTAEAERDKYRMEAILMPLQDKTAAKMLNNVAEFLAATLAKPDHRAWEQLLIYCPREVIERRLAALSRSP